jgi:hypothetical protein
MDRLHRDTVFQALPRPTVLLDTDLRHPRGQQRLPHRDGAGS